MKRSLAVLILALLLVLSAGCGKQNSSYDPADARALLDSGCFSQALETLDSDMIAPYLALTEEPKDAVLYTSLEGGYEEFAILVMADDKAAEAAVRDLEAHVAARKATETAMQYKPGDLPKLENAVIKQLGPSVLYAVADDPQKAASALDP